MWERPTDLGDKMKFIDLPMRPTHAVRWFPPEVQRYLIRANFAACSAAHMMVATHVLPPPAAQAALMTRFGRAASLLQFLLTETDSSLSQTSA